LNEFHAAIVVLDDRSATVDPVAAVDVSHPVDVANGRAVNVATDHAIEPATPYRVHHRILEVIDEADRALYFAFGVPRQGPVTGNAQRAPHEREPGIEAHEQVVGNVAKHRNPAVVARDLVEFIAVQNGVAPPIRRDMDVLLHELDVAERGADIFPQDFVMVAGNEYHPGAMACPLEHLLDEGVLLPRPVDAPAHGPEIDDIADQVEMLGFEVTQE